MIDRNLKDNLSDLKAQVAANQRGILLMQELIREFGIDTVQSYMYHIQRNAETAVRSLLQYFYIRRGGQALEAIGMYILI